ncbi:MAG TPA: hypothetical protein ENL39_02520 [Candidatus Aerophobetes bacterium]|uniref:Uncharacterized protein n=1 Tax=Aerophobetes bacterium TaxID=2030807 RepID=A0A7V5HYS7_UNCAE|nr:hypothetical protein [Candidatus Aerophobetes bacterium]
MKKYLRYSSLLPSFFLILTLILSPPFLFTKKALSKKISIDRVLIVSGDKNSIPDDKNKIVKYDSEIYLYAIVKSGGNYYLGYEKSHLPSKAKINGKIHSLKRWESNTWGTLDIRWYKIMPREAPSKPKGSYKWYSNVFSEEEGEEGKWRGWQIIEYEQYPLKERGWSLKLDKKPGTERFRVEIVFNGKTISSPGRPSPNHPSGISPEDYDKGIKENVHRISRLSNHPNRLIRYIEALRGVPWLWGADYRDPPKNTPSKHQSDFTNPVGIECSSLLVSALRAMGNKNLIYTTTENIAMGKYTQPITSTTLTLVRKSFFKNWIPKGIYWTKEGRFYVYGSRKIQIRDKDFNLITEIEKLPFEIIDIAVAEEGIYCIGEKDFVTKIFLIEKNKKIKELFVPEVERIIKIKEKDYTCKVKITPVGIEVKNSDDNGKRLYLFDLYKIYIFDQQGKRLKTISLEKINDKEQNFVGTFSLGERYLYFPLQKGKIAVYNMEGKFIKVINFKEEILDASFNRGKVAIIHPFPLRVEIYNEKGLFMFDFGDVFLNEKGKRVKIKIGSSPSDLQVGDLLITVSPTYHLLVLYEDNGNRILDSEDKVICAGHHGVEIRKVSYFEKRKFVLRRLDPSIKR